MATRDHSRSSLPFLQTCRPDPGNLFNPLCFVLFGVPYNTNGYGSLGYLGVRWQCSRKAHVHHSSRTPFLPQIFRQPLSPQISHVDGRLPLGSIQESSLRVHQLIFTQFSRVLLDPPAHLLDGLVSLAKAKAKNENMTGLKRTQPRQG